MRTGRGVIDCCSGVGEEEVVPSVDEDISGGGAEELLVLATLQTLHIQRFRFPVPVIMPSS